MSPLSVLAALALPFLLIYLLVFIRMSERSLLRREGAPRAPLVSIRDAGVATLALDLVEVTRLLDQAGAAGMVSTNVALVTVLLLFHMSVFVLVTVRHGPWHPSASDERTAWSLALQAYVAFALLMTNAVTVLQVVQLIGRSP